MSNHGSNKAIIFALAGNMLIAIIKYIVAFVTGSAAMLAESIHSTADSFNQVLLLIGHKRAKKLPSEMHSLGYANEVFFWSLMVAVLLFFVGALFSIYEGVHKLMHPEDIKNVYWIFAVLVSSIAIEAKSFQVAFGEFRKTTKLPFIKAIRASTQVSLVVVVLEDSAAMAGLIIVLISTLMAWLVNPIFDALGSITVGILLLAVSILLIAEVKNLIVGESMPRERRLLMRNIIHTYKKIGHINRVQSMVMGDSKYLVLLSVDINDEMKGSEVEDMIEQLKLDLKKGIPEIGTIYIEAQDSERNRKV
ncbi:MAG: cation diffusion facilitator family transporter [Bacteroidales bacterium]|nr:cation diffusion facilitator family transporter [Bacteroidales bacterium]